MEKIGAISSTQLSRNDDFTSEELIMKQDH